MSRSACSISLLLLARASHAYSPIPSHSTGELVYRPTDNGSTENARLGNSKLFKILFKLLYLRFPPLQICTCVFHTCIFHPCIFVLTYSVLAYSILRYFRFPYLRFQSPPVRPPDSLWQYIERCVLCRLCVGRVGWSIGWLLGLLDCRETQFTPPRQTRHRQDRLVVSGGRCELVFRESISP